MLRVAKKQNSTDLAELDKEATWQEKRKRYFTEKSKDLQPPADKDCTLEPKYMFDSDTFVLYMCFECRLSSRKLEVIHVDGNADHLRISLCRICRANTNILRRSKFFNHDLQLFKKHQDESEEEEVKVVTKRK
ncbi:hypothetical protein CAEBREN_31149 [Caenorhabditis brenneri]|uniref:Uncharacterized protein n=1 Tax=Caenorhabditis brenneri TaxID=135651 RepID=G0NCD2_CAEBE|nr:hypothetical protein CAEBREN_31149 [Caenorhabditis brenneri]